MAAIGHHGVPMQTRREAVAPEVRAPAAGPPGVRGGTAPRQPHSGTHEVWPRGVCCSCSCALRSLLRVTVRRASPANAALQLAPSSGPRTSARAGVGPFYSPLSNRSRVMRGSMAAELSTFSEKPGATRIPRTLSAGTPLDSRFPM